MPKKIPSKIKIEGKPKYIQLSDDYNFFSSLRELK